MNAPVEAALSAALATLGLQPDADARAVRRAYATQLKQIDQATQLQAFQALREAYEILLAGIAGREAEARSQAEAAGPLEAAGEPPTPPVDANNPPEPVLDRACAPAHAPSGESSPAPALPTSAELADAVFQPFAARVAAGFTQEEDATAALSQALADDRLLNLEARTIFEWQVAQLIMSGWRPGHEFLFGPACELFGWEKDRAHLRIFGQLGAALDAAINEKLIFFLQDPDLQLGVLRRLRGTEMPSIAQRRRDLVLVQAMVQRYPNWLRLVTSQENINSWFRDQPEAEPAPSTTPSPLDLALARPPARRSHLPWLLWILAVLMVVAGLSGQLSNRPKPGGQTSPWAGVPSQGPATTMPSPPSQTEAAGAQYAFLGPVTFARTPSRITVDEVDPRSQHGRSTLRPGDELQGCAHLDKRFPLTLALERGACSNVKRVDPQTGVVTYGLHVLRQGKATTAAIVMPPSDRSGPAANAAILEDALKAAATISLPRPAPVSRTLQDDTVRLGHVTFRQRQTAVVVATVGERSDRSFGTLQAGDVVMGCMAGNYHQPLTQVSEVRQCLVTNPPPQDASTTPYMFRVLRNSRSQPASLTLRQPDAPAATASRPQLGGRS